MNYLKAMLVAIILSGSVSTVQAEDRYLNTLAEGNNDFGPYIVLPNSFVDRINFRIAQASSGDFGVGSLSFTLREVPHLNIEDMSMSLFDGNNTLLGGGLDFSLNSLSSGNYYLQVLGNATGTTGGMYGGSIAMTSLPVPEPGMGSSLVAGLLMLSFMALRRRNM